VAKDSFAEDPLPVSYPQKPIARTKQAPIANANFSFIILTISFLTQGRGIFRP
jgi:hypothetical protein